MTYPLNIQNVPLAYQIPLELETTATDTGQLIVFEATHIYPLGYEDIKPLLPTNSTAPIELRFKVRNAWTVVDGKKKDPLQVEEMRHNWVNPSPFPAALVSGGWIPLLFSPYDQFMADTNVVVELEKMTNPQHVTRASFDAWVASHHQGTVVIDPSLFAYEGGSRKRIGLNEFTRRYRNGAESIAKNFPNHLTVINTSREAVTRSYRVIDSHYTYRKKTLDFLCEVCPLLAAHTAEVGQSNQLSSADLRAAEKILRLGVKHKLTFSSFAIIAALSCIFKVSTKPNIGKRLIKPTASYSRGDAWNAASDLFFMELCASALSRVNQPGPLATSDLGFISFWSNLIPWKVPNTNPFVIHVTFGEALFPKLTAEQVVELLRISSTGDLDFSHLATAVD